MFTKDNDSGKIAMAEDSRKSVSCDDVPKGETTCSKDRELSRIADFLFEAGMLRKTPRSGYQFLGTGQENVAEHSFRTSVIGYVLARRMGADVGHTVCLCLFHDIHEARIGDFNYVNRIYNTCDVEKALRHATEGTGMGKEMIEQWRELEATQTLEARIAQDADQLDFILNLKEEADLGNTFAAKWLDGALPRLRTEEARELADEIMRTGIDRWWFDRPDKSWWSRGNGHRKS
jgi:putative hydrolase of HD superfamily